MCLYHATLSNLQIGATIQATKAQGTYVQAVAELEKNRPDNCPSRSIALFATNSPERAYIYAAKQFGSSADIIIYKVEMPINCSAPMCLVHQIEKRISQCTVYDTLATEYWNPKKAWEFYEYFGPEIKIIDKCIKPKESDIYLEGIKYDRDFDRASKL